MLNISLSGALHSQECEYLSLSSSLALSRSLFRSLALSLSLFLLLSLLLPSPLPSSYIPTHNRYNNWEAMQDALAQLPAVDAYPAPWLGVCTPSMVLLF
jgi:hypothetical protein